MDDFKSLRRYDQLYSVSDLHLGGYDGQYESSRRNFRIFNQDKELAWFIDEVTNYASRGQRTAFVLNGDIVDFLARPNARAFDAENAVQHLRAIIADDHFSSVWKALQRFVVSETGDLVIVLGNHDVELALPNVQNYLTDYLTSGRFSARAHLILAMDGRGFRCQVGQAEVLCTHGNEVDDFNVVDYGSLGLAARALNFGDKVPEFAVNAGSTLVTSAMNAIKRRFQWVDLLKPEREAAIRILCALPRAVFHELALKRALAASLEIVSLARRDRRRIEQGLLGSSEAEGDGGSLESSVEAELELLMDQPHNYGSEDTDRLLRRAEQALKAGMRPTDLLASEHSVDDSEELLNIFGDIRAAITSDTETKQSTLRAALKQALEHDCSFSPTAAPDPDLEKLDGRVGIGIHFLLAGHTHFEKSLERKFAGTYYFNSGTWIRLINLQGMLEAPTFEKVWNVLLDGSMECLEGLRGAPNLKRAVPGSQELGNQEPLRLTTIIRTVVHLREVTEASSQCDGATKGAVIGELLHVPEMAGRAESPLELEKVPNTRRTWYPGGFR